MYYFWDLYITKSITRPKHKYDKDATSGYLEYFLN